MTKIEMNNLKGKIFKLQVGTVKVVEVKNDVVYMQNINNEKDTRETSYTMFMKMLNMGAVKEVLN